MALVDMNGVELHQGDWITNTVTCSLFQVLAVDNLSARLAKIDEVWDPDLTRYEDVKSDEISDRYKVNPATETIDDVLLDFLTQDYDKKFYRIAYVAFARRVIRSRQTEIAASTAGFTAQVQAVQASLATLSSEMTAKADLINGILVASQLPPIAVTDFLGTVASDAAMVALSGQKGDWCIRSDTGGTYIVVGDPTQVSGWKELSYPTSPVFSVNGYTGAVALSKADIGLGNIDNTSDANKPISTAVQTALNGKQAVGDYATNTALAGKQDSLGFTPENAANKGVANGYASLDSGIRLPAAQLPVSAMEYQGSWTPVTNTPPLSNATGNTGDVYRASADGVHDFGSGSLKFLAGDTLLYSGTAWQRTPNPNVGLFFQTVDKTVADTVAETSVFGTGTGSLVIPANSVVPGTMYKISLRGLMSATNGDSSTVRIKFGSTTLLANTSTISSALSGSLFVLDFDISIRSVGASGSALGFGYTLVGGGQGFSTSTTRQLVMDSVATIDTTVANTIDVTYQWGTARTGNSVQTSIGLLEVKG